MRLKKTMLLLTVFLVSGLLVAGSLNTIKENQPVNELPIIQPNELKQGIRTPVPVWDTNRVWTGATANLTRKIDAGKYFKGALDDTIRLVTVQSGGTRNLVIATDTMSTTFRKNGFRIETPYTFTSGSTPHAVAIGDVDGDEYTDIVAAHSTSPYRLIWFEWDGSFTTWAPRDSFAVNAAINDITFGDGDNDPTTRDFYINIAQTSPSGAIMKVVWTGTEFDTLRILLSGGSYYDAARGIAVGDIRSDLAGNEIYVVGGPRIWQVYYNGLAWDTTTITSSVISAYDVVVGDVNLLNSGNELCVVHGLYYYQVSIWNWTGAEWTGTAWHFTTTWGSSDNTIAIGDILKDNPGNELVLVGGASTSATPVVGWYAPTGDAWVSSLPKSVASQSDYGVVIGDINRFRSFNSEFVLSGGGSLVEIEQHDYSDDIGTYLIRMHNPTAIINQPDTVKVVIFNSGSNPQSGFTIGYRFKTSPITDSVIYSGVLSSGALDSVKIPVTMDFLGMDTLYAFTDLTGDQYIANDTTKLHIEVYDESTKTASNFNADIFPPVNASMPAGVNRPDTWWRAIISGPYSYNWSRYTSGSNPTCTPVEGYAMAGYPSYYARFGSQARLRTHRFNIGSEHRKVMLRFYMYHDPGYSWEHDSIIVEYSYDDATYNRVAAFHCYNATAGWYLHDVEIGHFPPNTDLYIGFRSYCGSSSYSGNNLFIDSVRVFVTAPSPENDAGIASIKQLFPKPVIVNEPCSVKVIIKNYGLQTLTSIPVFYTLGEADTVWETWTGALAHNDTVPYTFNANFVPTSSDTDTIYAGTRLSGDQNPNNDVASLRFSVCPLYHTPPYSKNFDEDWLNSTEPPFCGWRIINGGTESPNIINDNDWHRYVLPSPARTVARVHWSPIEVSNDWLISPRFDCSQMGTYTLSYWHYYNDYTTARLDSGRVLVSTDGGTNWQTIHFYSNADDSGSKSVDVSDIVAGQNNVKFAFHYVAENEYWWYVDDFLLDYQIGIVESEQGSQIPSTVFLNQCVPNPFGTRTKIKYGLPKKMRLNISIYNAIGQLVKTLVDGEFDAGYYSGEWDGRNNKGQQMPAGIYFIHLNTPEKKIVKKAIFLQ